MAVKLRRPILVGGLGLSFGLWMLDSWKDSLFQLGEFSVFALALVGGGLWLFKPDTKPAIAFLDELPSDRDTVEKAIALTQLAVQKLAQEAPTHSALSPLQEKLAELPMEMNRSQFKVAVTGGKSVGKTTIAQLLQASTPSLPTTSLQVSQTQPLFSEANPTPDAEVLASTDAADYVLFVVNGDLTETEFKAIQQLNLCNQRSLLVFNKQDRYQADERANVLHSLKQRFSHVVPISAAPQPIKVRQHQADGSIQEWMEQSAPDISQLTASLSATISQQGQNLIWATTIRQAHSLKNTAKDYLNQQRRDRAYPIIEQYQWIAAGAAFANPLPALDILATAAVSAQMIVDLGQIYQQKFSLEQAKAIAGEMGGMMLKLGLVEISTKAISTVLKTNAATFAVGGILQGVSAAYLTRVAALALIEYFQVQEIAADNASSFNWDALRQNLQTVFQQNQQIANLRVFVSQGVKRLLPDNPTVQIAAAETIA